MSWFPKAKTVRKAILASAIAVFSASPALSQGFADDYAQDWTHLEDDVQAIQQVGCFSSSSCDGGGCDAGCDSCCGAVSCCPPWWAHRTGVVGQWLYLRPGNTDIVYTIEQNDTPPNDTPTGPVGYTAIDAESGVRVGFSKCIDQCSSIVGSFSSWHGSIFDRIEATPNNILLSEVLHPSRLNTGAASLEDTAEYSIDFQLAELAYRRIYRRSNSYVINWKAGLQYGNMEQDFDWNQREAVAVGLMSVDSEIDFDGWGLMAGIDMERHDVCTGLSIYGKGTGSALAGEWNAFYRDSSDQTGGGVIANEYKDFRVTPLLELELGVAWQSKTGHTRINAGYMTSAWYDAVSTRSYIDSFRQGRYVDIGETITFNGLVLGGEIRF